MAKNTLYDFDAAFANNTDAAGQSTAGSANANTIDTIFQKLMSVLAVFADEIGGIGTVGGTADAITLVTSATYPIQSLAAGVVVAFKAAGANTAAATINVDSLGAKAIRRQGDSALSANDIVANGVYMLRYDTAYNSAAGAWVLLNPTVSSSVSAASTTDVLTGSDATKYATADAIAALWEKGSDIASATTLTIAEGGYFHVTGTTTITDIDFATAKNGRWAMLVFDGVLTLTHNATTLVLPGGANITTAAGDSCLVYQDNGDNVRITAYQRADGTAIVVAPASASSMTLLGTLTMSSSPQAITGIAAGYRQFYCELESVKTSGGPTGLSVALSSTNGSSYGANGTIAASISSNHLVAGFITIGNVSSAIAAAKTAMGALTDDGTVIASTASNVACPTDSAAVANAIRFTFSSANGGTIRVYGVK